MAGTRVYIGGLNRRVIERDVEKFFKSYGKIRQVLLKNGYAFIDFDDRRDADDAVHDLNGRDLLGDRVTVEHAKGIPRSERLRSERGSGDRGGDRGGRDRGDRDYDKRRASGRYDPPQNTKYRLIIENLSSRATWRDVKDFMRQSGEVTFADAHRKRKNEGIVDFATHRDMKTALDKLDDTELFGRRIRLVEDRTLRESYSRSRSRSRSRSKDSRRSRSKSRSKSRERSAEVRRDRSVDRNGDGEDAKRRSRSKERSRSRSPPRADEAKRVPRQQSVSPKRSRSRSVNAGREPSRSPRRSRSRSGSRDMDQ